MINKFVQVNFDLHCEWKKTPPTYRIYVNHELFTERTYIWGGTRYLKEMLQVNAPPGKYVIRVDNLGDPECQFKIRNLSATNDRAQIVDHKTFEIMS